MRAALLLAGGIEVGGAGYRRAPVLGGMAAFPCAEATWGVVVAFALGEGDLAGEPIALAAPVFVAAGLCPVLDVAAGTLATPDAPPPAAARVRLTARPAARVTAREGT